MLPDIAEAMPKDAEGKDFEFFATFSGTLNPKLDHMRNVGPLDRPLWLEEVAKSKFMVSRATCGVNRRMVALTGDSLLLGVLTSRRLVSEPRSCHEA